MLPIRNIAINVNYMNGITLSLLKMEISIYYSLYLLCNGCVRFFIFLKSKEIAGIKDIEKIR